MSFGVADDLEDKDDPQGELNRIKGNIERAVLYFKENVKRFHDYQKMTFKTALTSSDKSALNTGERPILEFNVLNAPVSRQCGEFSKQEPSIEVSRAFGSQIEDDVIEVVDGHIRHIFFDSKRQNTQYHLYRDMLSGGFSDSKVFTEYVNEESFDQIIKWARTYNPTMTFFDPMAKEADKSDAEWCVELFPFSKEQFKKDFPDVDMSQFKFVKYDGLFNWSFKNQEQYVVILADYYEKKKIKKNLVKLANNASMLEEDYNDELEKWNAENHIEQPPAIIERRKTDITKIVRYKISEVSILEKKPTSYKYLPIVFFDGDSVILQDEDNANMEQFTKPYVYHAESLQRLMNFTGQVIGNDFENMVQNKFMIAEEALPTQDDAIESWNTPQKASLLIFRAFSDVNPDKPLPTPIPVTRVPLPPEVMAMFQTSMTILQNILGSYDASLAQINEQDISGKAIVEAATLSNAAAMPYIVNYMQSLTQVANIIVDLIPKYYKTPRTIPVIKKDGTKDYVRINQEGGVDLNYDSKALHVKVEAGVNFAIAKNKALQQLTLLMKVSPEFGEFMNEVGLEILLDNMEFRNVDILKSKVKAWRQKKMEEKQNQPDPEVMKAKAQAEMVEMQKQGMQNEMQKTQLKGEEISAKALLESEKIILEKQKADNERLEIMMKAGESKDKLAIAVAKASAEEERAAADLGLKAHHQTHTQFKEFTETLIKHHLATKHKEEKNV